MSLKHIGIGMVSLLLTTTSAWAQQKDPKFAHADDAKKKELEKPSDLEWKASAQAGLVMTTGNSRTTTLAGGAKASRKEGLNMLQLEAGGAYARSSIFVASDLNGNGRLGEGEIERQSTTTTKAWYSKARYDRFLTGVDSLYGTGTIGSDKPAGKKVYGGGQLGYSRIAFKNDKHAVLAEAGYDFTYEDPMVGDSLSIHSARAYAAYRGKLSEDTGVEAALEGLYNLNSLDYPYGEVKTFKDRRHTGRLALTTKIYTDISLRFGFEAKHDSAPSVRPALGIAYEDGFFPKADELDTKTEATLIINFL